MILVKLNICFTNTAVKGTTKDPTLEFVSSNPSTVTEVAPSGTPPIRS
jgi:hypothetical protein